MQLIFITIAFIALCVFLLSFNIIFRKNGKFPDTEIGNNKEMRKKGLMCAKSEEKILWSKKGIPTAASNLQEGCSSCSCCCSAE
jgi:hypothetical protein